MQVLTMAERIDAIGSLKECQYLTKLLIPELLFVIISQM